MIDELTPAPDWTFLSEPGMEIDACAEPGTYPGNTGCVLPFGHDGEHITADEIWTIPAYSYRNIHVLVARQTDGLSRWTHPLDGHFWLRRSLWAAATDRGYHAPKLPGLVIDVYPCRISEALLDAHQIGTDFLDLSDLDLGPRITSFHLPDPIPGGERRLRTDAECRTTAQDLGL